jgi:hypothetical protein
MTDPMIFEDELYPSGYPDELYPDGYPDELIPERCFIQDHEMHENYPDIVYYYQNEEDEEQC